MKRSIALLCLLIAATTQAGTYRWVGENGQTHFGDRPPANAASDEVTLKSTAPSLDSAADGRKRRLNEFLQQSERERAERNQAEAERQARAARQQSLCEALRARLKHLESVSGIYRLNNEGERVFVDDEENQRIRRDFQAKVRSECGP